MTMDLDARQRAMLAEMKVPFWWPQALAERAPVVPSADAGAAEGVAPDAAALARVTPATPPAMPAASRAGQAMAPPPAGGAVPASDQAQVDRMDWPQLRQAVQNCNACGLCEGRKAPVFVADPAPAQADWMIVGDPPDEQEEREGLPFAGPQGLLLDNMLRAVQCSRDGQGRAGARVSSVVKCRPAAVRSPARDELERCAVYLRREIALTRPRVIVAMGRFAAISLLAADYPQVLKLPFGQLRGTVYRTMGIAVVVTYHPSKLLRAPAVKADAWADLCLARAHLQPTASP